MCVFIFIFALIVRLEELKFEFCQISWDRVTNKLAITGKLALKFNFRSSLLKL